MTRTTEPTLEADDVVRRLRGALDELTADISETTVADRPTAWVYELRQRPSRRTWLVPAAAAAAVVAVVAGVVVVGNRDDGGPSGPPVSVPETGVTVPGEQTVAGATFAPLDGLEPAGVPTFDTVMTAPLGAVWVSSDGPDDWFVAVRQESDRELSPGTLDGGVELEPVDVGGRTLYVDPDNGSGKPTVYRWRPGGQLYVVEGYGLASESLVEFAASIQPGSGVPFIQTSDDPEFRAAEATILDPQPTYLSQPWTIDGAAVRLSAATDGLARHLADVAASMLTIEPVSVAGESGYRIGATDGTHVVWPAAASADLWMHVEVADERPLGAAAPGTNLVDDVIGAVVQRPTGLVVGGTMAAGAREQSALRGWITRTIEGDEAVTPLADIVTETLTGDDGIPATAPVVIDALSFSTVGQIVAVTVDLTQTRRVVLVTADSDSPSTDELDEVLRSAAASTPNVVIADWTAALADGEATQTAEDWVAIVADAVFSVEADTDTGPTPDITSPPPSDPTPVEPVATDAPPTEATVAVTESTPADPDASVATTRPMTPMDGTGFVVGASVTLGAAEALAERGFVVDAEISRHGSGFAETIEQVADAGLLPDVVVVQPGGNGPISEDDMVALMEAVADARRVIVVTDRPHRPWSEPNNELVRSLPDEHPNVVVLDWAVLSDACTGDCFALDEIHLGVDGRTFYADLVLDAATAP
jgi:hypothetical protein